MQVVEGPAVTNSHLTTTFFAISPKNEDTFFQNILKEGLDSFLSKMTKN